MLLGVTWPKGRLEYTERNFGLNATILHFMKAVVTLRLIRCATF